MSNFPPFLHIGKLLDIKELNNAQTHLKSFDRKQIPILLIDNEPFENLEFLQANRFDITYVEDLPAIDYAQAYPIVVTDIKGVGKMLGSNYDGGHIIREVHLKYPFKTIIAYSGHSQDPSFNKYLRLADDFFKKDIDRDDWLERLDGAIKDTTSPINLWYKIRNHLLANEVPLFELARLEDEYVRTILEGKKLSDFPSKKVVSKLPPDARAIVNSFAANVIFKLVFSL